MEEIDQLERCLRRFHERVEELEAELAAEKQISNEYRHKIRSLELAQQKKEMRSEDFLHLIDTEREQNHGHLNAFCDSLSIFHQLKAHGSGMNVGARIQLLTEQVPVGSFIINYFSL